MKLIIEVDLEQVPNIAHAAVLISEAMLEWTKATGQTNLAALVERKYNWMPQYNVGLVAEAANSEDIENALIQVRVAVTDSKFDTSPWGKQLMADNPERYTTQCVTKR